MGELSLDRWDLDTMQDGGTFLWCTFRRPVRPDPDSIWELDLSLQLFQFFFTGMKNQSRYTCLTRVTSSQLECDATSQRSQTTSVSSAVPVRPKVRGAKALRRPILSSFSWFSLEPFSSYFEHLFCRGLVTCTIQI